MWVRCQSVGASDWERDAWRVRHDLLLFSHRRWNSFHHQMVKSRTHPPSFRTSTSRPACARFPHSLAFFPSSSRLFFLGTFLLSPIHLSFVDDFLCFVRFSYPIFNFVTTNLYDILMQTDRQSRVVFCFESYRLLPIYPHCWRCATHLLSAHFCFRFDFLIFVYILYLCFESLLLFRYRSAASLFFDRLSLYHHTRHDYLFAMMPRYLALYSFPYFSPFFCYDTTPYLRFSITLHSLSFLSIRIKNRHFRSRAWARTPIPRRTHTKQCTSIHPHSFSISSHPGHYSPRPGTHIHTSLFSQTPYQKCADRTNERKRPSSHSIPLVHTRSLQKSFPPLPICISC